jgi:hypothetical protein
MNAKPSSKGASAERTPVNGGIGQLGERGTTLINSRSPTTAIRSGCAGSPAQGRASTS